MNVSFDPALILLAIVMAVFGYYLGKRKTEMPFVISVVAFFTAFIPPVALVFLIILLLKKDTRDTTNRDDWL